MVRVALEPRSSFSFSLLSGTIPQTASLLPIFYLWQLIHLKLQHPASLLYWATPPPLGAFELMKIVSFRSPTQEPDLMVKFFFGKGKKKDLDSNIDQALKPRPCKPFSSEQFTRSSELFILKHFHIKRYSICIPLSELDTSGSNAPPPGTDNGQMPMGCTRRGVWKLRLHRRYIPVDVQKPY